jgi:hypothetical protein
MEDLAAWTPPSVEDRENGFRCLVFFRERWRDVVWVTGHSAWMFGFASSMLRDVEGRSFAPLPKLPADAPDFWS